MQSFGVEKDTNNLLVVRVLEVDMKQANDCVYNPAALWIFTYA